MEWGYTQEASRPCERSQALPWTAATSVLLGSSFKLPLLGGELRGVIPSRRPSKEPDGQTVVNTAATTVVIKAL